MRLIVIHAFALCLALPSTGCGRSPQLEAQGLTVSSQTVALASLLANETSLSRHLDATLNLSLPRYWTALAAFTKQPLPAQQAAMLSAMNQVYPSIGALLAAAKVSSSLPTASDITSLETFSHTNSGPLTAAAMLKQQANIAKIAVLAFHIGAMEPFDASHYLAAASPALALAGGKNVSFSPGVKTNDGPKLNGGVCLSESGTLAPSLSEVRTAVSTHLTPLDELVASNRALLNSMSLAGIERGTQQELADLTNQLMVKRETYRCAIADSIVEHDIPALTPRSTLPYELRPTQTPASE